MSSSGKKKSKGQGLEVPASEGSPLIHDKGDLPTWLHSNKQQVADENSVDTRPRRPKVLIWFLAFSTFAGITSVFMILAQLVTISVSKIEWPQAILRFYVVMFCLLFILAEVEVKWILGNLPNIENWIFRGFLYSFVAMIGIEESYSVQLLEDKNIISGAFAAAFLKAVSSTMFFVGILYMIFGICRLKNMRDRMQLEYQRRYEASQIDPDTILEV